MDSNAKDEAPIQEKGGKEEASKPPIPERIDLNEFQKETVSELHALGVAHALRVGGLRSKHQLVFEILSHFGRRDCHIEAEGFLEITNDGQLVNSEER